jgi:hypothetical protein
MGYFVGLVEWAEQALRGKERLAWADRFEAEEGNVRAALAWAVEHTPDSAQQLTGSLWLSLRHVWGDRAGLRQSPSERSRLAPTERSHGTG